MTKLQTLIYEISNLSIKDLELILNEILKKIDRRKKVESILDGFIGSGQGIWEMDAQQHVNSLREDDRL
ncbi:MAG: hypothetical protein NW226_17315 [Microscillaceae bacterium]|nr:hypothetical protein [Microscillaceae bacterium]